MSGTIVEIGVKSRKEIIKYVTAKLKVEDHVIYSYACKACEKETGESNIVAALDLALVLRISWETLVDSFKWMDIMGITPLATLSVYIA